MHPPTFQVHCLDAVQFRHFLASFLAARQSTSPKRNCVANFAPVKACCVLAVENLSLF